MPLFIKTLSCTEVELMTQMYTTLHKLFTSLLSHRTPSHSHRRSASGKRPTTSPPPPPVTVTKFGDSLRYQVAKVDLHLFIALTTSHTHLRIKSTQSLLFVYFISIWHQYDCFPLSVVLIQLNLATLCFSFQPLCVLV